MIQIVLHGCGGRMGRIITALVKEDPRFSIAAGVDSRPCGDDFSYPVYSSLSQVSEPYDVVIDFTNAEAVSDLLQFCVSSHKPLVLCTTGLSEKQEAQVREASAQIPLFFSANMSLGVNLLTELCQKAAAILAPAGFDIEINERHHNRKLDAPSGTALSIGRALIDTLGSDYYMTTDRCEKRQARDPHEIGMTAMRGGTIVGEHTVLFAGHDELFEIKHNALSREVFGNGALNAAAFLINQEPGLYSMKQLIEA